MVHCVSGDTPLEAWRQGAQLLINSGPVFNLITIVTNPTVLHANLKTDFNPANFKPGIQTTSEVATTIFPYTYLGRNYTRQELYQRYIMRHDRARTMHPQRGRLWGTYFDRMIRFGSNNINQLERVISALENWQNNPSSALVIHTSSADTDHPRPLGAPCLQFIELLCPNPQTISLLAVYRNHDFFGKVLGNFIGLGQLLNFICHETNRTPGTLVCHSAHAYFNTTKTNFKSLVQL